MSTDVARSEITKIIANQIRVLGDAEVAIGAVPTTLIDGKDRLMHDIHVARAAFMIAFDYAADIDRVAIRKKGHQEEKKSMIIDAEEVRLGHTEETVPLKGFSLGTVTSVPYPVKGSEPDIATTDTTGPLEEWPFKPNTEMTQYKAVWKGLLQEYLLRRVYRYETHMQLRKACIDLGIDCSGARDNPSLFGLSIDDTKKAPISTLVKLYGIAQQCYAPVEPAPENPLHHYEKDWRTFIADKLKGVFEITLYPKLIAAAKKYNLTRSFNSQSVTLNRPSNEGIMTLLELYAAKREDEGVVWS